jgi:signal transduction histidine kinase
MSSLASSQPDPWRSQLARLLAGQEQERREIAAELHEDTAQALAGIMLGLGALERTADSEPTRGHVRALRSQLDETLRGVRRLAVGLRPPVLDQLGLAPALSQLARERGGGSRVRVVGLAARLSSPVETSIYRIVEGALAACSGPVDVRVEVHEADRLVTVVVTERRDCGPPGPEDPVLLGAVDLRVELLGGSTSLESVGRERRRIVARIPLADGDLQ